MSSAKRAAVAVAEASQEQDVPDSSAWDEVANGQLDLDFSPRLASSPRRSGKGLNASERSGVKEAIIRWLEEQM